MIGKKAGFTAIAMLSSLLALSQVQVFRLLIPVGERVVISIGTRVAFNTATMGSELALQEGIQSGLITLSAPKPGQYVIQNNYIDVIRMSIPTESISIEKQEKIVTQTILPKLGWRSVVDFQAEFGIPMTGRLDEKTNEGISLALNTINEIIIAHRLESRNRSPEVNSFFGSSVPKGTNKPTLTALDKLDIHRKLWGSAREEEGEVAPIVSLTRKAEVALNKEEVQELQTYLKLRGYYNDIIDGLWGMQTENAAKSFLFKTDHSGFTTNHLTSVLYQERFATAMRFFLVGYGARPLPRQIFDNESIRSYQQLKGLSTSGIIDDETLRVLNQEAKYVQEMIYAAHSDKDCMNYVVEHKKLLDYRSPIASTSKIGSSRFFIIENKTYEKPKSEVWYVKDGDFPKRISSEGEYQTVIAATAEYFSNLSDSFHYVTLLPDKNQQKVVLLHDNEKIEMDRSVIEEHLEKALDRLHELFPKHTFAKKPKYIIQTSLFDKALQKIGDEEFTAIANDKYTNEDMYDYLNSEFGDYYDFFLADDLEAAVKNLSTLPMINTTADLKIAYSTGAVDDDRIPHTLMDNHDTSFFVSGLVRIPNTNVVLVTGHKDHHLLEFIRNHGKIGNLKNKILVVFSCFDAADAIFYSACIKEFGIKEVVYYPYEISSASTEIVLNELLGLVKSRSDRDQEPLEIGEAIQSAVHQLKLDPPKGSNSYDIEKLRWLRRKLSKNEKTPTIRINIG